MKSHVTMKVIAREAGVTQATVSMALANNARIPEETRKRIRRVAEKLGYRPNPYVTALMRARRQGRTRLERPVVALINGLETATAWKTTSAPTVRQMREGAIECASRRGYLAQEFWLRQDGMTAERLSGMLHARGIQGVLLGPLEQGAPTPELRWEYFSAVRLGVPLPNLTLTAVCNDHFFSSFQVAQECQRRGYRRPGLVILETHRERFHARWDGGLFAGSSLHPDVVPVKPLLLKTWEELLRIKPWFQRERPDVIISPVGETIRQHLLGLGWKIPDKVGVASLACAEPAAVCSGIYQNGHLIGATAMDTLISLLERNERGLPRQASCVMIEGSWNPGQTLRLPATTALRK